MPILFDPKRLDEGDGIQLTLERNKAKYHWSCQLKFKTSKLERKRKSKSSEKCEVPSAKFTRSSLNKTSAVADSETTAECFICNQTDTKTNLHEAMSLPMTTKLRKIAQNLLDDNLLTKLSIGDVVSQEYKYHCLCLTRVYNTYLPTYLPTHLP